MAVRKVYQVYLSDVRSSLPRKGMKYNQNSTKYASSVPRRTRPHLAGSLASFHVEQLDCLNEVVVERRVAFGRRLRPRRSWLSVFGLS